MLYGYLVSNQAVPSGTTRFTWKALQAFFCATCRGHGQRNGPRAGQVGGAPPMNPDSSGERTGE